METHRLASCRAGRAALSPAGHPRRLEPHAIPPRLKKLIGSAAILAFLAFYIWAVGMVAPHLPRGFAWQLLFYVSTGMLWGVPVIPLITWMNRETRKPAADDRAQR